MPSLASKYEDFWPVDLCVRHKLCKRIASDRHRFRVVMENYKQKRALSAHRFKASTPTDEAEMPLGDIPPSYEEVTGGNYAVGEQVHPDAVPEDIEEFLKSCDFDFGHLTDTFVTSRAGLFNMQRLELIATWPAALRRDHFERHFSSVLDDVEIEVLNMRFSGLKQARR
ncbi:hypothetical protein AZE42_06223 [Rhizopogon vesiculosus]|uniref:Uncharacterized protein n=1 Tax=Rhizopogon vesiculosus TaxID=180088 RepID=A0A1J8PWD7_9AGAM|nr:hypothetical protein AZE42_06223 [Rhizopogon vesiculosus]